MGISVLLSFTISRCKIYLILEAFLHSYNMYLSLEPEGNLPHRVVEWWRHGPLTKYVKLRIAHVPGMPRTFSPPLTSKETTARLRSRHASRHVRQARAVMHVGIAYPWWWGKRSRHSRRMRNPQFYVSGKRPMTLAHILHYSTFLQWFHRLPFDSLYNESVKQSFANFFAVSLNMFLSKQSNGRWNETPWW